MFALRYLIASGVYVVQVARCWNRADAILFDEISIYRHRRRVFVHVLREEELFIE